MKQFNDVTAGSGSEGVIAIALVASVEQIFWIYVTFLGEHTWQTEGPRLWVESKLQM